MRRAPLSSRSFPTNATRKRILTTLMRLLTRWRSNATGKRRRSPDFYMWRGVKRVAASFVFPIDLFFLYFACRALYFFRMWKYRFWSFITLVIAALVGFFVYKTEMGESRFAFKLGLDLRSGSHLVYRADTSLLEGADVKGAMESLREVIERRVNLFGVSEPIVQVEEGGLVGGGEKRLIVELPGVTDLKLATELIGKTPLLEFKLMRPEMEKLSEEELGAKTVDEAFIATPLTGRFLKKSQLTFDQTTREPQVLLRFNDEGEELFAKITKENVGRILGIFLDGIPISTPVIREEIKGGVATISGGFTPTGARDLVRNLNYGALPVPITLASTQTVGATLGDEATAAGMKAGLWSFAAIALFLILWYRLPGLLAAAVAN